MRRKNTMFKTVLTFGGLLVAGAIFKKHIIEFVQKIPFIGDFVKEQADKQA